MSEIDKLKKELAQLKEERSILLQHKVWLEVVESVSTEAIALFDEGLCCIESNHKFSELLGYSREELIGRSGIFFAASTAAEDSLRDLLIHKHGESDVLLRGKYGVELWTQLKAQQLVYAGKDCVALRLRDITDEKKLQQASSVLNEEYQAIFNNTQVGIILVSDSRIIQHANHKFAEIMGYDSVAEVLGKSTEIYHLSRLNYEEFQNYYTEFLDNDKIVKTEYKFRKSNGDPFWVSVSGSLVDKSEHPSLEKGVVWVFEDIDDKKNAEAKLRYAYHELEVIFNNSMIGLLLVRPARIICKVNQVTANIFGFDSPEDLEGKSTRALFDTDEHYYEFWDKFYKSLVNNSIHTGDLQVFREDGTSFWIAISGKTLDENVPPDLDHGVIWSIMDITKRKSAEEKLLRLSRIDSLTGLFNRRYFYEMANFELEIHKRYSHKFVFVIIDLDNFKQVNDIYGHAVGDKTLEFFSLVLKRSVRKTDIVGRLGGEEFGICLLEVELLQARTVIEKVRRRLKNVLPNVQEGIPAITISAGLVEVGGQESIEAAAKRADDLLYKAKGNGRNQILIS